MVKTYNLKKMQIQVLRHVPNPNRFLWEEQTFVCIKSKICDGVDTKISEMNFKYSFMRCKSLDFTQCLSYIRLNVL